MLVKIVLCLMACLSSVSFQQAALLVSAFIQPGVFIFVIEFLRAVNQRNLVGDKPKADN